MHGFAQHQQVAQGRRVADPRRGPAVSSVPRHHVPAARPGHATPAPAGDSLLARQLATAVQRRSGSVDAAGMPAPGPGGPLLQRWPKIKPLRAAEHGIRWALSSDQRASDEMVDWNDERDAVGAGSVLTDEDRAYAERVIAESEAYHAEVEAAKAAGTYVYNEDIEDEEEEPPTPWVSATRSWVPGRRRP